MGAQGVLDACLLICCRSGCGMSSSDPCVCEPPLLCPPACGLCVLPLPLNYQILECKETYASPLLSYGPALYTVGTQKRFDLNIKSNFSIGESPPLGQLAWWGLE